MSADNTILDGKAKYVHAMASEAIQQALNGPVPEFKKARSHYFPQEFALSIIARLRDGKALTDKQVDCLHRLVAQYESA